MKFCLGLGSKSKGLFLSPSIKDKTLNGEDPNEEFALKSKPAVDSDFRYSNFSSKDESFFDTKAWFDSDSEDEFVSVNGDFTPSRGNTPVHHLSALKTQTYKFQNASDEKVSPNDGKKKLFDLLQETNQSENMDNENFTENSGGDATKSMVGSPRISETTSTWSTEATPNKSNKKEKTRRSSKRCCFPRLYPTFIYNERSK